MAASATARQTALHVKPGTEWAAVLGRPAQLAPEAFGSDLPVLDFGPVIGAAKAGELLRGNFPTHSRYPADI